MRIKFKLDNVEKFSDKINWYTVSHFKLLKNLKSYLDMNYID